MDNLVVLDCEIYPNYSLFAFKNIDNNNVITIELKGENSFLDDMQHRKLNTIMQKRTTFGFNSRNYDIPIILYALRRKTCAELHKMSSYIIDNNSVGWLTMKHFGLAPLKAIKHFDIQEPTPSVRVSLKLFGGRMHAKKLQDLPIEPNSILSSKDMDDIKLYCINDLDTTIQLYRNIADRIKLRSELSKQYGQDLLSKSDAQIAETVIKSELQKISNTRLYAPKIADNTTFRYTVPSFISFESSQLKSVLDYISQHKFTLDSKGSIQLPKDLKNMKISLGRSVYQLGIGGIHSTEKKQTIVPSADQFLIDKDVTSFYPTIILNLKLYPKHLGVKFLDVYSDIVKARVKAKRENNKVVNESLKIVINGSFGKLGSKYSVLYSPDLLMAVTLTGQLSLLMLIEQLEKHDISVVSANTDGFVSLVPRDQYYNYEDICKTWEQNTGFTLENTLYRSLYSRDVNNYLAVKDDGSKGKGIFADGSLAKNPQAEICSNAVRDLLVAGTPIAETIKNCKDVRQFLHVRSVTGGAVFRGEYLGRVVRWIYSTNGDTINYKKNGNKVPKSDGSRPIMELGSFPSDIDYNRYINEAVSILDDIGLTDI